MAKKSESVLDETQPERSGAIPLVVHESAVVRRLVGLEVKASASVNADDFGGLRKLAEASGKRFAAGYVLYDHDQVVPLGDRMFCRADLGDVEARETAQTPAEGVVSRRSA